MREATRRIVDRVGLRRDWDHRVLLGSGSARAPVRGIREFVKIKTVLEA